MGKESNKRFVHVSSSICNTERKNTMGINFNGNSSHALKLAIKEHFIKVILQLLDLMIFVSVSVCHFSYLLL